MIAPTDAPSPRYLHVPSDSCLGEVSRVSWAATTVVRAGEYHIGVRSSSDEVRATFEAGLTSHIVDDPTVRATYAIYESEVALSGARPLYFVYEDCNRVFTTTSLRRAVAVVAGYLEQYCPRSSASGAEIEIKALALVDEFNAVLVPWMVPYLEPTLEMRAARAGAWLLEGTSVHVCPGSAELLVPASPLLDAAWASPTGQGSDGARLPDITPAGRRAIVAWLFMGGGDGDHRLSRAEAVASGMALVHQRGRPASILRALAEFVQQVEAVPVAGADRVLAASRPFLARATDAPPTAGRI